MLTAKVKQIFPILTWYLSINTGVNNVKLSVSTDIITLNTPLGYSRAGKCLLFHSRNILHDIKDDLKKMLNLHE